MRTIVNGKKNHKARLTNKRFGHTASTGLSLTMRYTNNHKRSR